MSDENDIVDALIDAVWESTAHTTLISTATAERALNVVAPLIEAPLRAENEKLREALNEIAYERCEYTTGEDHSRAIWIARRALDETEEGNE